MHPNRPAIHPNTDPSDTVWALADQAKVGFGFLSLNTLSKLEQAKEPAREEQVSYKYEF
jgi:hypothetical protein